MFVQKDHRATPRIASYLSSSEQGVLWLGQGEVEIMSHYFWNTQRDFPHGTTFVFKGICKVILWEAKPIALCLAAAAFLKFFEVGSPATAFALLVQGDAQLLLPSSIFLIYHPQRVSAVLRNPPWQVQCLFSNCYSYSFTAISPWTSPPSLCM